MGSALSGSVAAVGGEAIGAQQQRNVVVLDAAIGFEDHRNFGEKGAGLVRGGPVASHEGDAVGPLFQRLAFWVERGDAALGVGLATIE